RLATLLEFGNLEFLENDGRSRAIPAPQVHHNAGGGVRDRLRGSADLTVAQVVVWLATVSGVLRDRDGGVTRPRSDVQPERHGEIDLRLGLASYQRIVR